MARKLLLVLAGLASLLACFVGWQLWENYTHVSKRHQAFFEAIDAGDVERMFSTFEPSLQAEVDPPVLAAWMKSARSQLGRFKNYRTTQFVSSTDNLGSQTEAQMIAEFQNGSATAYLVFRDKRLFRFRVESAQIASNWLSASLTTEVYRDRGQKFIRHILSNDADSAFEMMSPELQADNPLEDSKPKISQLAAAVGNNPSIVYQSETWDRGETTLAINYLVINEKSRRIANVEFEFSGLKSGIGYFHIENSDQ